MYNIHQVGRKMWAVELDGQVIWYAETRKSAERWARYHRMAA